MASMDRRKVLMISFSFVMLESIMMLISPNYALLLVARIILAIGVGVFFVTSFTVVAKLAEPERQARAIYTLVTGANAALILGLPMGRVLNGVFGWKAIFWFTGIFSLMSILLVKLTIPSTEGEEVVPIRKQIALLKSPKILLTMGISFFWIAGYSVLYSYITPFIKANFINERTDDKYDSSCFWNCYFNRK
ncbi:MFS transporter [Clostridium sp. 19966]|uniref:MFS transporter n=1 Tax=Clostridium sp. 19966 TaxID=2768166 RepID=UPI0028EF6CC1|nr:MFS transporter [Clostridium sp. 19966]